MNDDSVFLCWCINFNEVLNKWVPQRSGDLKNLFFKRQTGFSSVFVSPRTVTNILTCYVALVYIFFTLYAVKKYKTFFFFIFIYTGRLTILIDRYIKNGKRSLKGVKNVPFKAFEKELSK